MGKNQQETPRDYKVLYFIRLDNEEIVAVLCKEN